MIRSIKDDEGQSTIEFILSFSLGVGFLFAFYKMAMLFTNGYLVHYVTFQASRAYMVSDTGARTAGGSDGLARTRANQVFNFYKLPDIIPGFESNLRFHDPESHLGNGTNLYVGVKLSYQDFIFIPGTAKKITVPLVSESFLGLEPTRGECFEQVCKAIQDLGAECSSHVTVIDNGC